MEFINWLNKSLAEGKVMVNKSPLFMVPGGMLMSQEMFQLFVREHSEYKNWQAVQNAFLALDLHAVGADGNPISRFEQSKNQQMHNGVVFSEFAVALPDKVQVQQLATGKVETMSALELINKAQYPSQFTQQQSRMSEAVLQKLDAAGKWQKNNENATPSAALGVKTGG